MHIFKINSKLPHSVPVHYHEWTQHALFHTLLTVPCPWHLKEKVIIQPVFI